MIELISQAFSANITYALLDMFTLEVILTILFKSKESGIDINLGLNNTRNTRLYVIGFVISGVIFFLVSNVLQNPLTSLLMALGWPVHVIALGMFGLVTFWVAKIMLSRSWRNTMVKASLFVIVASVLALVLAWII